MLEPSPIATPEAAGAPSTSAAPVDGTGAQSGLPAAAGTREIGGPAGPEPTRYGDWEKNGRCIDF